MKLRTVVQFALSAPRRLVMLGAARGLRYEERIVTTRTGRLRDRHFAPGAIR